MMEIFVGLVSVSTTDSVDTQGLSLKILRKLCKISASCMPSINLTPCNSCPFLIPYTQRLLTSTTNLTFLISIFKHTSPAQIRTQLIPQLATFPNNTTPLITQGKYKLISTNLKYFRSQYLKSQKPPKSARIPIIKLAKQTYKNMQFLIYLLFIIINNNMKLIKTAFRKATTTTKQQEIHSKVASIYDNLKQWDQGRASTLQYHMRIVDHISKSLDGKIRRFQLYVDSFLKLMEARIRELNLYAKNGVNNSDYFLGQSHLASLKPQHLLLKNLIMQQSLHQSKILKRSENLSQIYENLLQLKKEQCCSKEQNEYEQRDIVNELKINIRFMVDCQLADIVDDLLKKSGELSDAMTNEVGDVYLVVKEFVKIADQQVNKHRDIGKELISLVDLFIQREKKNHKKLRNIIKEWLKQDHQSTQKDMFQIQLSKNENEDLIESYYREEIQNIKFRQDKYGSVESFLQNIQVKPFKLHQQLLVLEQVCFYNKKVEARIIVTMQKYLYLFRVHNSNPDFVFLLSKHTKIKKMTLLTISIEQTKKVMLVKQQTEFSFSLEFNLESDLNQFMRVCQQKGDCQLC